MPDFYEPHDVRLIQYRLAQSAANADSLQIWATGPPAGKIWTVFGVGYYPSVNETQTVSFEKVDAATGYQMGLLNPVSLALNPSVATCIEQGMTFLLFPGQSVQVRRAAHTAGSLMTAWIEYVETDIPLYEYLEPQERKKLFKVTTQLARRLGGGGSSIAGRGIVPPPPGGGGGRER